MTLFGKLRNAAAAGLALSALGAMPASAQDEDIKIGMVNLSLCCAYFVGMDAAVKDEASHFSNVKVLSTDAKGDVAKLTSDVEDLLNQDVDVFIISGAWIEAMAAKYVTAMRMVMGAVALPMSSGREAAAPAAAKMQLYRP